MTPDLYIVPVSKSQRIEPLITARQENYVIVNDAYTDIFNREERYQILFGGAAAGKSDAKAVDLLIKAIIKPYFRLLYCRKYSTQIRESQFSLFVDIIKRQKWEKWFSFSTAKTGSMEIICTLNGNRLIAHGLDNVDGLTSIHDITDVWLEEPLGKSKSGGLITYTDFLELDRRLRTSRASCHIHFTFNPIGTGNWIYENFFDFTERGKAKEFAESTFSKKTTFKDNAFIDHEAEDAKFKRQGAYEYRVFALGEWGLLKAKNAFFYEFSMDKHVWEVGYNNEKSFVIAIDFNLDIMATTVWQLSRDYGKVFNAYEFEPVQGLEQRIRTILSSPFSKDLAYCLITGDATGQHRHQVNPNNTHYKVLKEGLKLRDTQFKVASSNMFHKDSRLLCNAIIRNADFAVNTGSINLQSDLQATEADGEDGILKKAHDPHHADTFRYVGQNFLMQYLTELLR